MKNRLLALGLSAGLALLACHGVLAQSAPKTQPIATNAPRPRAILAQNNSIRFELPLTRPAVAGERAVAWLLFPDGFAWGETSVALREGSRSASLTLPWPWDKQGIVTKDLGWYRIAYRLEVNGKPIAHDVFSIGAIATDLLGLRLAHPEKLAAGKPLSVRVFAGNPITREPYRGVRLQATLLLDALDSGADTDTETDKGKQTLLRTATTGLSGEALLNFPVKPAPGQTATLTVIGTTTGWATGARGSESGISKSASGHGQATIEVNLETSDRTAIHIETDKPLHKPGEIVHLRALVFGDDGHASANRALTLTIKDPEDKTLLEAPLTTNRFGIAAYDWKTTPQLATGEYKAEVETDHSDSGNSSSETIRIQRYELPEFSVSVAMDHGYYLGGQTPVAHVHAGYLFGKPVAAGSVRLVRAEAQRWNPKTGKWEKPDEVEQTATLDANGDADLHLDVKRDFDDFRDSGYERFTDIRYRAIVTDSTTGRSEPRNFTVRLTHHPVHIYVRALGGNDREGDYMVSTSYADGEAVACKVTLDWMDEDSHPTRAATATTDRYGLAKVHLRYPIQDSSEYDIRLTARDREGRTSIFDDRLHAEDADSIWISLAHSLLKPGQPIEAALHGPAGSIIDVEAFSGDGILAHQQVRMHNAEEPITILADSAFHGLVLLQAYSMNSDEQRYSWDRAGNYKAVLYPEDRELKVKLTGLRASYLPGAEVDAGLSLQDASGSFAKGALGVAVIDAAVEQRAETEEEANERWYGWNWWESGGSVAGVTLASLNRTKMEQPVPNDLDLAAEAVLQDNLRDGVQIEESNDSSARNEYEAGMKRNVQPLEKAVLADRPARLPATLDSLQSISRAAKLDDALLRDPWNTPYRVATKVEWSDEVVSLQSAGPDKRFGTEDDFTIELARRNYFALQGERLTKLLEDAVAAGSTLPRDEAGLKALARSGGMDLDATLDPQGKPYHYQVLVRGHNYSVQAFPHDAVAEQDGRYPPYGAVWSSPSIDYFSRTEARMEAALRDWAASGKPFPENEAQARQAFSDAGIDFDALRDPLGQRLKLRVIEVMAYTREEKVKGGGGPLEETTKFVTHMLRALQIVRPTDASATNAAQDVVAQFLHPITEQTGSDLKPKAVEQGTFKGNTGAIGGAVTDTQGAAIVGAKVTATSHETDAKATCTTSADGTFLLANLSPGSYTVRVNAPGFKEFIMTEVSVFSVSLTTVDAELQLGEVFEKVTVQADPVQVETTSSAMAGEVVRGTPARAKVSEPTFTPRLRHVFEETAYWAPSLETNASGHASLHFRLPDSLTTWKLHALASTVDGRIAALDQTFKSFQPFFVDLDTPQVLTVGDEITLPVNLRNYTTHGLALPVTVKPADWLTLLTPSTVQASVAANGTTAVRFGLRATSAVEAGPLRITAANAHEGDSVEKTVRVHPDGEPRSVTASGLLREGPATWALDLPANAIPGSIHAELLLYPNLGVHLLHSMKAVLERPYGCGEQTISSTYPSLLFLELLKTGKSTSPLETEAQSYLQQGYDRLLGYFGAGGGLTYWGRSDETPDPALTAYGIEFLTEAEPYVTVDRNRIVSAVGWLVANQKEDGSWTPHYGESSTDLNLYVAEALHRISASDELFKNAPKDLRERVNKAVTRAVGWAAASAAAVHDPYANALRLQLAGDAASAARLRAELAQTAQHDRDGAHWTQAGYSPFYGWGHAGELETTALVLGALRQDDASTEDRALANDALFYLLGNQDRYGIWESGQATVRVLHAMLPIAIEQMKAKGSSQEFRLAVNGVALTGNDAEALRADPTLIDAPRSLDLTALLKPGHNELVFSSASQVALASAEASASYYIPWAETATPAQAKTQTGKDYGLDFGYSCATANARVSQPIDCTVNARRFGSGGYGMLLAEVGLPPGADVDRASLVKLLDSWTISRYELQPDRIVFYLWSWKAEGSCFSFSFTPRYAIHAKAAPATLFDYYNPDLRVVLAPQIFQVTDSSRK
jgi:hypothetical protein